MEFSKLGLPIAVSLATTLAACGGKILPENCVVSGTYAVHFAPTPGTPPSCDPPPDTTAAFDGSGVATDTNFSAASCPVRSQSVCGYWSYCATDASGQLTTSTTNFTFTDEGSHGTGTVALKTTNDADGSVVSDCTFTVTYTRQ